MDYDLLRSLRDKENKCRNYQRQADELFRKNNMQPSKDQCLMLQRAADLESEMAGMTIGAAKEQHLNEMHRLDEECNRIIRQLEKGSPKAAVSDAPKKQTQTNTEGKSQEELEIDRAVRTWYKEAPTHSFEEVAGMEELKGKLHGCIADAQANKLRTFLKIPKLNSYFFVGPPGCGKTYISEAFAHELIDKNYKFISILGSDIISKYAGTAEKSVTRLFEEAGKQPCIVFVDEIDSLCKSRSLPNLPEYAANITTSFLTGYNKIHNEDSEVIFIAATNYPNRVDSAMLDRAEIIRLPLPDKAARSAAFQRGFSYKDKDNESEDSAYKPIVQLAEDLTFDLMAEKTWRFNYRDIERLTAAIKKTLFRELMDLYRDEETAIEVLMSGDYMLTRTKFEEVLTKVKPSPKEQILNDLLRWEQDVQSQADIAETNLEALYDCEENVYPDAIYTRLVNPDPVYPLEDALDVDPLSGTVEIKFGVNVSDPVNLMAIVNNQEFSVWETPGGYAFPYTPKPGQTEVRVYVRSEQGSIGRFTVKIHPSIAENEDFDL